MSGHSKWATIKHKKGAADKARGKLFAKLARQIEASAPIPRDPALDADLRRIQEGVNDGLRRRLSQLETALRALHDAFELERPDEPSAEAAIASADWPLAA